MVFRLGALFAVFVVVTAWGEGSVQVAPGPPASGRSLFLACEFKKAARVFERALVEQPENAVLHFWLGKSYARMAEISSPLSASRNGRKARTHLEEAVRLNPRNAAYREELFEFYVDSPEWFHGGLAEASRLAEDMPDREDLLQQIAASRAEHSGGAWWMRRTILWTAGTMGHALP